MLSFNKCPHSYKHQWNNDGEYFHHPPKCPVSLSNQCLPLTPRPWQQLICFLFVQFSWSRVSCQWNHTIQYGVLSVRCPSFTITLCGDSSVLWHVSVVCSVLLLSRVPLYEFTLYWFIHQLMDIWLFPVFSY